MNYKNIIIAFILILSIGLEGCSSNTEKETNNKNEKNSNQTTINQETIEEEKEDYVNNRKESELNLENMFTDRDKEIGYQENTAIFITLKDNSSKCNSDLVSISGNTIVITGEGTFVLSGSLKNGQIIVDAEKTDKLQIVLNNAEISCDTSAAFYVRQADKVFLTLEQGTKNVLSNQGEFKAIDDNNIDAAIFSKEDLTLNGNGNLIVTSTCHGIVSKDDLVFTGGTYKIEAVEHAINGKESVRIADGNFQMKAGEDGIHAKDKDDASLGFAYIAGGNFEITSGDDGIHADNRVIIRDGIITIFDSYEGIEGLNIEIFDGTITVKASDDGLNAAGGNDGSGFHGPGEDPFAVNENNYIKISGGNIKIDAEGDGIDSNGNLFVSGGTIYVLGPTNRGNGALDYNGTAEITGGIVVALGAGGMEQNFGDSSTQGSILVNTSASEQKGTIILKDKEGRELLSYTPEKSYRAAVISCPEIKQGETYTIALGEEIITVEMENLIYGTGHTIGGKPGGFGRHGSMGKPEGSGNRSQEGQRV